MKYVKHCNKVPSLSIAFFYCNFEQDACDIRGIGWLRSHSIIGIVHGNGPSTDATTGTTKLSLSIKTLCLIREIRKSGILLEIKIN